MHRTSLGGKLLYIHHTLCNLILLSSSLHANQETRPAPSKLLEKKIEEPSAKVSNNSLWNSFSYIYINIGEVALTLR